MVHKKQFIKVCLGFVILFLIMYAARILYESRNIPDQYLAFSSAINSKIVTNEMRNYASMKVEYSDSHSGTSHVVDQKYERVATITSNSSQYEQDETKLNQVIENNKGVVQFENKTGLNGKRRIDLVIGVKPDYFDTAVKDISTVGKLISTTVFKTDKTAEYRQMIADKATLEKTKESYLLLREKGGTVTELLALEEKIIEIERLIQNQSVELGEYNDDNAFCTINFSLEERTDTGHSRKIMNILGSSLQWTVRCYLTTVGSLIATLAAAFILLLLYKYGKKHIVEMKKSDKPKP